MDAFQKIKLIGKVGMCSDEELLLFLTNYPVLLGNEFIFSFGWSVSEKYIDDEIEYFIKGLHIIEEKHKTNRGHGFGSPSPSFMIIQSYAEYDYHKAVELEKWVAMNGGNYYIKIVSKPEKFRSRIQTKSMIKSLNEIQQREKEERKLAKIKARKIISEQKIEIHNKKVKNDRIEKDKTAKLSIEQLLIKIVEDNSRPVYFYEDEIFKIEKNQLTKECKIKINQLIDKIKNKDSRKTRKITRHLMIMNDLD